MELPLPKNPRLDATQRTLENSPMLPKLARSLAAFHQLKPDLKLDQVMILLAVARSPGITTAGLVVEVGITQVSVSRSTNALSSLHRNGSPGLGLIDMRPDPAESRRHCFHLTKRGLAVVGAVLEAM